MNSCISFIRKLQDPELVVQFQNYCGIHVVDCDASDSVTQEQSLYEKRQTSYEDKSAKHLKDGFEVEEKRKQPAWSSFLFGDQNVGGNEGSVQNPTDCKQSAKKINYIITNRFLYYLFLIATKTGDEIFYITFFPFWNWNVDGAVMREVIYIWTFTMYIGQALKDILRVPRPPSPPVIRLDSKWGLEYGLPSTHAMVAFSIPFSILILSLNRYQLNFALCFGIALTWCVLVCTSRVYLGMHSVLDIISGLVLIGGLLIIILPVIGALDHFMLTHPFSPLISITLTIAMVVCYPTTDRWTSARGDTTIMVGVGCGCLLGYWLNYQIGMIYEPEVKPPFSIIWPSLRMVGTSIFRTSMGLFFLAFVRAMLKPLAVNIVCTILQVNPKFYKKDPSKITEKQRLIIELVYKFVTYTGIGFTIVCICPILFKFIGIERLTFYTEM